MINRATEENKRGKKIDHVEEGGSATLNRVVDEEVSFEKLKEVEKIFICIKLRKSIPG